MDPTRWNTKEGKTKQDKDTIKTEAMYAPIENASFTIFKVKFITYLFFAFVRWVLFIFLLSLGRYLCWWTISLFGIDVSSIQ